MKRATLSEQDSALDFFARAVAASLYMTPRRWLARFGKCPYPAPLPKHHKHLAVEYKETLIEMDSEVKKINYNVDCCERFDISFPVNIGMYS